LLLVYVTAAILLGVAGFTSELFGHDIKKLETAVFPNFKVVANIAFKKLNPPTGILHDKQIVSFINMDMVSGDSIKHDTLDALKWRQLYTEMYNSYVGTPGIPPLSEIDSIAKPILRQNKIPIFSLALKYNKFKNGVLKKGLIVRNDEGLHEGVDKSISPYEEKTVFAVSVVSGGIYYGSTQTFCIDPWNTPGTVVLAYSINFDDGSGYRNVLNLNEIVVAYPSYGEKVITVVKTYQHYGNPTPITSISSFKIFVFEMAAIPNMQFNRTSNFSWNGLPASYQVSVLYGFGNTSISKPIIFVEGFDPTNSMNYPDIYVRLMEQNHVNRIRSLGYDLIIMNFSDGGDYIQRNGMALVDLIQWVNAIKTSDEDLVIVGASMGGIVTRYALLYMENPSTT